MSHTIGPWRVMQATSQEPDAMRIIYGGNLERVAIIPDVEFAAQREAIADARLIAAAPDLLDALYLALPYVEEGEEYNHPDKRVLSKTIRALISKVEGQQ